jgi:hypothetical protein
VGRMQTPARADVWGAICPRVKNAHDARRVRRCQACGVPEERIIKAGTVYLNLEPHSQLCLSCLVQRAVEQHTLEPETGAADFKKAQSGDED